MGSTTGSDDRAERAGHKWRAGSRTAAVEGESRKSCAYMGLREAGRSVQIAVSVCILWLLRL